MPTDPIHRVLAHVRTAVPLPDGGPLADDELLDAFLERHDEAAFAALVHRHGPMVWGVCRRLLNHHDAEDAFQATFLVLVRKAATVLPRARVGNWLYGVAHQAALQARRTAARRRAREVQVRAMPDSVAPRQGRGADVQPLLDQELSRLPDTYRAVLVLCDLEGRTRKEVARQLGLPEGTVAGRLARARAMLAERLTRRGVTLSGGALAALLVRQASARVPNSLVQSTLQAASCPVTGQTAATALSADAVALAEGVRKAMFLSKFGIPAAVVLVIAALGCSAGLVYLASAADRPGSGPQPGPRTFRTRAVAPLPRKNAVPEALRPFQGRWQLNTCDSEAKGLGAAQREVWKWRWTVKGDEILWGRQGQEWKLSLKVDPAKEPKEIDLTYLSGPFKGKKSLGMYQWGRDGKSLLLSLQDPGAEVPRPRSISWTSGGQTTLLFLDPIDPVDAKKELAALQGTWTFDIVQTDPTGGWPKPIGKGPDKTGRGSERRWRIKGNQLSWTSPTGQEVRASFTIDPSKVPKHIDLTFLNGPHKGQKCQGVYERGGVNDIVLWICVVDPGKKAPRPKDISYESFQGRSMIGLIPHEPPAEKE